MRTYNQFILLLFILFGAVTSIAAPNDPPVFQYELKVTPHNGATQILYFSSWEAAESAMKSIDASTQYLIPDNPALGASIYVLGQYSSENNAFTNSSGGCTLFNIDASVSQALLACSLTV